MKKRVLSFLLLLSMLVSMVPVMAVSGAETEGGEEETPRSETYTSVDDFYALYKTEGLVAFFDALNPENGTLKLDEGKWNAKVYDAEQKTFVVSDTVYATITGGVYDAEQSPTGWKAGESGFGYDDPNCTAPDNKISFDKALLSSGEGTRYSAWTVETLLQIKPREGVSCDVSEALRFGPVVMHHGTGEAGSRWLLDSAEDVSIKDDDGSFAEDARVALAVTKSTADASVSYCVMPGAENYTAEWAKTLDDQVGDVALHLMKGEQGTLYTVRIYSTSLRADEITRHRSLDTLIRLGVAVEEFNKLSDEWKDTYLLETVPALDADATKEDAEDAIAELIEIAKERANAQKLSEYDKLYVGSEKGPEPINGGKLVALFNAFSGDFSSAVVSKGLWINKVGKADATFGNAQYWSDREGGSVGFDVLFGQLQPDGSVKTGTETDTGSDKEGTSFVNTRLNLGLDLLPKDDYTIQYVAKYNPVYVANPDGTVATDKDGNKLEYYAVSGNGISNSEYVGAVDKVGFISSFTPVRDGLYSGCGTGRGGLIWLMDAEGAAKWEKFYPVGGSGLIGDAFHVLDSVHTYTIARDETLTVVDEDSRVVEAVYSLVRDGMAFAQASGLSSQYPPADGLTYYEHDDRGDFFLSSMLPTDFYSLRIYDTVLTKEELAYNTFIDMAAYAKASLSKFFAIEDPFTRSLVVERMSTQAYPQNADEFATVLQSILDMYEDAVKAEDSLYVTDGLLVLSAAYSGFHTGASFDEKNRISWFNAVKLGQVVTVKGTWEEKASGGYHNIMDFDEYYSDTESGLYLDADVLPEAGYSIEMIMTPSGIVKYNEDGSYERYLDTITPDGIYSQWGFAVGPLRSLIFPATRPSGNNGGMEQRWCYNYGDRMWENVHYSERNQIMTETKWNNFGVDEILTYSIDFDLSDAGGVYRIFNNYTQSCSATIAPSQLYTNEEANNKFQLMVRMPGSVYALRVYNRVLSDAEKLQNHVADIIYYYDLDTSLLNEVLQFFPDDPTKVFRGLSDLSFDMAADEAQETFDARLGALWLSYANLGIRKDYTNGLRYYFDMDESTAAIMIGGGFSLEIGAVVNIGQNADPVLDGRNYDYKIVAYDSVAGKNTGFFVDEDTFAVTVKADSSNKEALLASIKVRGYIRLVSSEGEEMIFYVETQGDGYTPDTFFSVYDHMQSNQKVIDDNDLFEYLDEAVTGCYNREYVYLQADAAPGGNGTKDAPYQNFEQAFAAAKAKLAMVGTPTFVCLQAADGVYEMRNYVSVEGTDLPYRYSRFVITSKNNKSTLTSNKLIDKNGFVQTDGNIYVYQFAKDVNGNYPNFRYLYVNGSIADISHNGAGSINEADQLRYNSPFYRYEDGPLYMAYLMNEAKTLTMDEFFYPEDKVALRTRFAYYRDQFMAYQHVKELDTNKQLSFDSKPTIENATTRYNELFDEFVLRRLALNEVKNVYASKDYCDSNVDMGLAILPFYQTQDPNATDEYRNVLKEVCTTVVAALRDSRNFSVAINAADTGRPTLIGRPDEGFEDKIPSPSSSGVYDRVKAMLIDGELSHTSQPVAGEATLVQGKQFLYYRDAFLAYEDMKALSGDALNVSAVAPDAEGSALYRELFTKYLYEQIAVNEIRALVETLKAQENGTVMLNTRFALVESALPDAPAAYYETFLALRDEILLDNFNNIETIDPAVEEADGPYEGYIPMYDPRDEAKVYFDKDLVGNQSFAISQGLATLAADAEKVKAEAKAAYEKAYAAVVEAEAKYAELRLISMAEAEKFEFARKNIINEAKEKLAAYEDALVLAAMYVDAEYEDRYSLKDSGLEFKMCNEWNFNIMSVSGVDYDDVIRMNGKEYVAVYADAAAFAEFSLHSEHDFKSRITTMQFSYSYLDENNEYYYDVANGKLYYYNDGGLDGLTFEYPTMNNMIYLGYTDRVEISKLSFTGLDDTVVHDYSFTGGQASDHDNHVNFLGEADSVPSRAPIYTMQTTGVTIEECTFHDLGCEGITNRGKTKNMTVSDCSFIRLGSSALRFGSGSGAWNDRAGNENVTVTNNYIDGTGLYLLSSPAVYFNYSKDVTISYNTILNTSYSAISIGWNWSPASFMYGEDVKLMHCDVSYNYIFNFMMEMGDGGAIYTLGGNAHKDEHTLFNWCHDNYILCTNVTGDGEGHFYSSVYHDGSSTNWETYNNVVVGHSFGAGTNRIFDDPDAEYFEDEEIDESFFETVDTNLSLEEYDRRMKNRFVKMTPYFTQFYEGSDAYNITYRDNFYINCRSTKTEGSGEGSQHYEAFRGKAREAYYIYVENMRYAESPATLPSRAEEIMYEAGCDWYKGDPTMIADNNY